MMSHHRKTLYAHANNFFAIVRGDDHEGSRDRFINEFVKMTDKQWDEFVFFMGQYPEHPFIKDPPDWKSKERSVMSDIETLRVFHKN